MQLFISLPDPDRYSYRHCFGVTDRLVAICLGHTISLWWEKMPATCFNRYKKLGLQRHPLYVNITVGVGKQHKKMHDFLSSDFNSTKCEKVKMPWEWTGCCTGVGSHSRTTFSTVECRCVKLAAGSWVPLNELWRSLASTSISVIDCARRVVAARSAVRSLFDSANPMV